MKTIGARDFEAGEHAELVDLDGLRTGRYIVRTRLDGVEVQARTFVFVR